MRGSVRKLAAVAAVVLLMTVAITPPPATADTRELLDQVQAIMLLLRAFDVEVDDDLATGLTLLPVLIRLHQMDRDSLLDLLSDPEFGALLDRYDAPGVAGVGFRGGITECEQTRIGLRCGDAVVGGVQ